MTTPAAGERVFYPDSDGKPMADNTKQYRWIVTLQGNMDLLFRDSLDVFVAGDLLWYPVEGDNSVRMAPDVLVALGRPKGDRSSYRQWLEGGVPPQVVFEVLSPGNRANEMGRKFNFYDQYGVEEYYIYDPETFDFSPWVRTGDRLRFAEYDAAWTSPRMGVRFVPSPDGDMAVYYPDGRPFLTFLELGQARLEAEARAEQAENRASSAEEKAARLAARLRELGIDPDAV